MKKNYVAPFTEEVNIEIENNLLQSSLPTNDDEINSDTDQGAGNHRGDWGNLWN